MKKVKNKPSVTNVVVNSIMTLNPDNSNNLAYSTQGRVLKGMCYSFTNDLNYVKGVHRQRYAEYAILKEDSRGDESTANSLQKLRGYLTDLESQAEDLTELKEAAYFAHYELFDTNYSVPIKGSKMQVTRQEIDSDWEPKQL